MSANVTIAPDADLLCAAARRLDGGPDLAQVVMHLASPTTAAAGIEISFDGRRFHFRGQTRRCTGRALEQVAADVAALVRDAARPSDRYLDLTGPVCGWVKVLRSGCRQLAFGSALLGAPTISLEPGVPARAAVAAVAAARTGELTDGGVLNVDGQAILIDAAGPLWVLRTMTGPACDGGALVDERGPAMAAAALAAELRTTFEATSLELTGDGSRYAGCEDFTVTLTLPGGWTAQVPLTVTPGGHLLGVDADVFSPDEGATVPDGFTACGVALFSGDVVAVHDRSQTTVLLTAPGRP